MKTFNEYLSEYLTESPLSRVWAHFTNTTYPAGILSAFRGNQPLQSNQQRTWQLATKVRQAGLGYTFVDGTWNERDAHGNAVPVKETSLVVIGNPDDNGRLKGLLRSWMREFDQDAVVYKPEDSDTVVLLSRDGSESETPLGTFHANKAADIMTKLRGRTGGAFVFEGAYQPMTWIQRVLHKVRR